MGLKMINYYQKKTKSIDVASFKTKATDQKWPHELLRAVIDRLHDYDCPFTEDKKGQVYINNLYRFDVLDLIPSQESLFDWVGVPDDIQQLSS